MDPSPTAIAAALAARETRLAVFDVGLRTHTDQWYLEERIPLEDVVRSFAAHDAFETSNGDVRIPLHEPGSAALTDEWLRVDPGGGTSQFFDPGLGRERTVPLGDLARSYPAWRARFWSDAYPIERTPPFMLEFETGEHDERVVPPGPSEVPTMEADAFFEAVRSTLVAMRERRREERRTTFQRIDVAEFLEDYGGISNLRPDGRSVDDYGQQVIELAFPAGHPAADWTGDELRRNTRLDPGDEVVVDGPAEDALPVEAELFSVETTGLELGVYWDSSRGGRPEAAFDPDGDVALTVGKLVDGRRYSTIAEAIDTVDRTDHARQRYAGNVEPAFADLPEIDPDLSLNGDQLDALRRGFAAEDVFSVHTPPWTGSRRLVWELARAAVDGGEQVCVFAPTNDALDRIIEGDSTEDEPAATSIRQRARSLGIEVDVLDPPDGLDTGADIVAVPLNAADVLEDHGIDLAIVDHAARIDVPSGAIPFAKAGRVILIGDPWQGPPSSVPDTHGTDLPRSIYDHISGSVPDATVALRCQYRMNQAIAQFPNRQCYEGTLINGGRNRTWTIDTLDPLEAVHVPASVRSTPTGSVYHDGEIAAILDEVRSLLDRGLSGDAIGVLTPYSAHIGKLRVALNEERSGLGELVAVGGIDRFRCHSRDAVIVSFVGGADPSLGERGEGAALGTETGLNVALTRAAKRSVLIGDWTAIPERGHAHHALTRFLTERGLLDPDLD